MIKNLKLLDFLWNFSKTTCLFCYSRRYVAHNESLIRVMHHLMRWLHKLTSSFPIPILFFGTMRKTNFKCKYLRRRLFFLCKDKIWIFIDKWMNRMNLVNRYRLLVDQLIFLFILCWSRLLSSWCCSLNLDGNHESRSSSNGNFHIFSHQWTREKSEFNLWPMKRSISMQCWREQRGM